MELIGLNFKIALPDVSDIALYQGSVGKYFDFHPCKHLHLQVHKQHKYTHHWCLCLAHGSGDSVFTRIAHRSSMAGAGSGGEAGVVAGVGPSAGGACSEGLTRFS